MNTLTPQFIINPPRAKGDIERAQHKVERDFVPLLRQAAWVKISPEDLRIIQGKAVIKRLLSGL